MIFLHAYMCFKCWRVHWIVIVCWYLAELLLSSVVYYSFENCSVSLLIWQLAQLHEHLDRFYLGTSVYKILHTKFGMSFNENLFVTEKNHVGSQFDSSLEPKNDLQNFNFCHPNFLELIGFYCFVLSFSSICVILPSVWIYTFLLLHEHCIK